MLRFGIGLLCAAAFVLILVILSGSRLDDTSAKAVGTAMALAFLSLTAVAGSHLSLRQPQLSLFGHLTVAGSAIAFLVTTAAIWSGLEDDSWKPAAYCLIIVFAAAHTSVLLASLEEADSDAVRLVRGGTAAALWLLVGMVVAEISERGRDVSPQALGVLAVIYALGTVTLPLLRRTAPQPRRQPQAEPRAGEELQVDHVCFVWPGGAESAIAHLTAGGTKVVEGPVGRNGTRGAGVSVYYRDGEGNLVELIAYG